MPNIQQHGEMKEQPLSAAGVPQANAQTAQSSASRDFEHAADWLRRPPHPDLRDAVDLCSVYLLDESRHTSLPVWQRSSKGTVSHDQSRKPSYTEIRK